MSDCGAGGLCHEQHRLTFHIHLGEWGGWGGWGSSGQPTNSPHMFTCDEQRLPVVVDGATGGGMRAAGTRRTVRAGGGGKEGVGGGRTTGDVFGDEIRGRGGAGRNATAWPAPLPLLSSSLLCLSAGMTRGWGGGLTSGDSDKLAAAPMKPCACMCARGCVFVTCD